MGHTRLGWIPKSKKWSAVVGMIGGEGGSLSSGGVVLSDDVNQIASKTLEAAEAGLKQAITDKGLLYTFYLLTQVVLAAREDDWTKKLADIGIEINEKSTLLELSTSIQNVIDDYIYDNCNSTDVSEIAQKSAGEALLSLAGKMQLNLFDTKDDLKQAIRELSTKKGFSELGQKFFGSFMSRYLNFYLSRITAANSGNYKIPQLGDLTNFNISLKNHCDQSALIVNSFCGEWYSKTNYKEGISLGNTSRFLAIALKKLQSELKQQRFDI